MKVSAEITPSEVQTAGDLHSLLDRFTGNNGERAIPHDAEIEFVVGMEFGPMDRGPGTPTLTAIRFTWEI